MLQCRQKEVSGMKIFAAIKKLYLAVALAFFPCLCVLPLYMERDGGFIAFPYWIFVLLEALIALPFFLAYLELGAFIGRLTDGRVRSRGEWVLGRITAGMAVAAVVCSCLFHVDGLPEAIRYAQNILYWLCNIGLPILWLVGAAVFKKRLHIRELLRPKGVWVTAVVIFLSLLIGGLCTEHLRELGYRYSRTYGWYNAYKDDLSTLKPRG